MRGSVIAAEHTATDRDENGQAAAWLYVCKCGASATSAGRYTL
jgi:hypothetical protein